MSGGLGVSGGFEAAAVAVMPALPDVSAPAPLTPEQQHAYAVAAYVEAAADPRAAYSTRIDYPGQPLGTIVLRRTGEPTREVSAPRGLTHLALLGLLAARASARPRFA